MNNKEFISELSAHAGYSMQDTAKLVDGIVQTLTEQLCEGNQVVLQNFGILEVKKKMERVMVSPITKRRMLVPPKLTVSFKPHSGLKDKFK